MFTLVLRQTGEAIGFCALVHPGSQSEVEIKDALLREFRGRVLVKSVMKATDNEDQSDGKTICTFVKQHGTRT